MEFLWFIVGLILLIKAADYFVSASIKIAKAFGVSELIIGATIVSIGTTLPEVMVSTMGAVKGSGAIAYGNAIGSIICNTAFIAAITLIFAPQSIKREGLKIPTMFFFTSFVFYAIVALVRKGFNRIDGIILVLGFVLYIGYVIYSGIKRTERYGTARGAVNVIEEGQDFISDIRRGKITTKEIVKVIGIIILSAVVIAFASNLLVDNGINIAMRLGVPESVIGITMIALGTSLPELTTAITSLVKGHSSLSLGNIIGANLSNVLLVSGVASTICPFSLTFEKTIFGYPAAYLVELPLAFIVMVILTIPAIAMGKTKRWQGILLMALYVCFIVYQFVI